MPTDYHATNKILLQNIENIVGEVKSEVEKLVRLLYGKNGNPDTVGMLEMVRDHDEYIKEQKEKTKWTRRMLVGLVIGALITIFSNIWFMIHVVGKTSLN